MSSNPFVYDVNPPEASALTGLERIPCMQGGDPAETTTAQIAALAVATGVTADEWVPAIADSAEVVTITQPLTAYYTRVNGTTSVVTAAVFFGYEAADNGTPVINITDLPFALASTTSITLTIGAGPTVSPSLPDVNTIRLVFASPLTIGNAGTVMLSFMYEPAA